MCDSFFCSCDLKRKWAENNNMLKYVRVEGKRHLRVDGVLLNVF